ncbi:MAG: glucose-1-phosphate adenylyltransferase subunit GlgD [Miniphocaeibacter sp.]|uniref:glucose-1-phosphate adenylyltransferase subunit GlgD n=1 Tax=Miniphocaeibacter sp. TaxID=3100973 RepID=UPI00178D0A18|nr:glucose-1-phosphate adenylyltransferase subunit GlgD [Gallicola sp.]
MQKCIGVVIGGKASNQYGSLCETRPAYMLPYGGRYRLIDFTLSNLANNDFSNVILYGGRNIRSTLDHVGNGAPWELNRRRSGLVIFPAIVGPDRVRSNQLETLNDTMAFYEEAKEDYLYIVDPMVIDKEDLTDTYDRFIEEDYDILLFYTNSKDSLGKHIGEKKLIFNAQGELVNIGTNLGTQEEFSMLTKVGFIKKEVFIYLVKSSIEKGDAEDLTEAIANNFSKFKIGLHEEKENVEMIRGLRSFYDSNMKLLDSHFYDDIFYKNGVLLTKSKDEPSTLYSDDSKVSNSLIANGCIIEGQVENSIIFRGVKVAKGAIVKNSILFQKTEIESDAVVINTITDKYVKVKSGVSIVGSQNLPYVIAKNLVVEK